MLGQVGFRRLWVANVCGDLGEQFSKLALTVTAVLVLHATAWQIGLITALGYGANLAVGLPGGVWVDRWRKKPVLVAADLCRAAAVASVPAAYLMHGLTVGQLMVVAALVGTANVFFETAHTSVLPVLVSREYVSEANARLQTSDTTMAVVGPGLAGQILRAVNGPLLYLVTAAMHLASSLLVSAMPVHEPTVHRSERDRFWPSLRAGLTFVLRHPVLRTFLLSNAAVNLGAGVFMAVVPIYALRDLHIGATTYGLVLAIGSVGGIIGSFVALPVQRAVGEIRAKVLATGAIPLAFLLMPAAAHTPRPSLVVGVAEFLFGLIITVSAVSATGARAKATPHRLLGRTAAASRFVTLGAIPIGALAAGTLATHAGLSVSLWLAVGLAALGTLACVCSPLLGMRELPAHLEAPPDHPTPTGPDVRALKAA